MTGTLRVPMLLHRLAWVFCLPKEFDGGRCEETVSAENLDGCTESSRVDDLYEDLDPTDATGFVYGHAMENLRDQVKSGSHIDTKIALVFSASAITVGVAASGLRDSGGFVPAALVAGAGVAFLAVAYFAVRGLRASDWKVSMSPSLLVRNYYSEPEKMLKHLAAWDAAKGYPLNKMLIERKAWALNRSLLAAATEVACVAAAVSYSQFAY